MSLMSLMSLGSIWTELLLVKSALVPLRCYEKNKPTMLTAPLSLTSSECMTFENLRASFRFGEVKEGSSSY